MIRRAAAKHRLERGRRHGSGELPAAAAWRTGAAGLRRRVLAAIVAALTLVTLQPACAAELRPWSGPAAAPALALRDLEGREHRLADYRGKVVVINFWATWCEPCREEMPSLQRLADAMAGRDFVLLSVDMAEGEPRVKAFLQQTPVRFPVLLDRDGAVSRAWKVKLLPTTLVIDPAQRIRHAAYGDLAWDAPAVKSLIEQLLKPVK
jgi:thiol-disulfide isomerase/thioredoxin